jgi:hypothetical protein
MKFYKITNKEENHFGFQYKDGLNIDTLPFNPSGDCEPGGIYFSREDILQFSHCGVWIREVTLPENEPIYVNPGSPKKWKSHRVILGPRRKITPKVIKKLIEEGANLSCTMISRIFLSGKSGKIKIIQTLPVPILLEFSKEIKSFIIESAVVTGREKILKYLLSIGYTITDYNYDTSNLITLAARNNKSKTLKYLVSLGYKPSKKHNEALTWATKNNNTKMVEYLISLGCAPNKETIHQAAINLNLKLVKYFVSLGCDPKESSKDVCEFLEGCLENTNVFLVSTLPDVSLKEIEEDKRQKILAVLEYFKNL